jgi:hypothetical protein
MYRDHPWLAATVSLRRPELCPHVAAHTEWARGALAGLDVPAQLRPDLAAAAVNLVRGGAMGLGPRDAGEAERTERFEFGLQRLLDGFERLAA